MEHKETWKIYIHIQIYIHTYTTEAFNSILNYHQTLKWLRNMGNLFHMNLHSDKFLLLLLCRRIRFDHEGSSPELTSFVMFFRIIQFQFLSLVHFFHFFSPSSVPSYFKRKFQYKLSFCSLAWWNNTQKFIVYHVPTSNTTKTLPRVKQFKHIYTHSHTAISNNKCKFNEY